MSIFAMRKTVIAFFVALTASIIFRAPLAHCAVFQYDSHGRRDPFVPLVGYEKPAMVRLEDITSIDDIKLEGIAGESDGKKIAVLNGEIVRERQKIGEVEIEKITDRLVTIVIGGKTYNVKLVEEGG